MRKNEDGGTDWGKVGVGLAVGGGMAAMAFGVAAESTAAVVAGGAFLIIGIAASAWGVGARGSSGGETGPPVSGGGGSGAGSSGGSGGSGGGVPSATGCFAAGTLVTLGDGSRKAIETVDVGDLVLSQREDGGALGAQRVSHIWQHTVHRTLLLNSVMVNNSKQRKNTGSMWTVGGLCRRASYVPVRP